MFYICLQVARGRARNIAMYNIKKGSTLSLVIRLRGGSDVRFDIIVQLEGGREITVRLGSSDIIRYLKARIELPSVSGIHELQYRMKKTVEI